MINNLPLSSLGQQQVPILSRHAVVVVVVEVRLLGKVLKRKSIAHHGPKSANNFIIDIAHLVAVGAIQSSELRDRSRQP